MQAVLGIDAAWTLSHPSGVALVAQRDEGWQLIAAASSYIEFQDRVGSATPRIGFPTGSRCDATALLNSANLLCGRTVSVVTVDMPLARSPISQRRPCDNVVSRTFARQKCGTHSPSSLRPGKVSDELQDSFARAGYPLCTTTLTTPCVIEVYPHPALLALCGASQRLPYKMSKLRKYWPELGPAERRFRLYRQWSEIVALLDHEIRGVSDSFPVPKPDAPGIVVKAYEDRLDAVICAWVGICALQGRAMPLGDVDAAIWVPNGQAIAPRLDIASTAAYLVEA